MTSTVTGAASGLGAETASAGTSVTFAVRNTDAGVMALPTLGRTPDGWGAATSALVATSPQLEGIGGRYVEDNVAPSKTTTRRRR
ncbi:hypothetical protein [Streptomyces sp. NPDC056821]|uniref:hypothetical protein n=1 Tax=unclassified Streptomyces TaxID=2593676 RepID=UPI0036B05181